MSDQQQEETQLQQTQKKIYEMEVKCHEQIKEYERSALKELERALESEAVISLTRQNPDGEKREEEMFFKILEKPVMYRARDKMKLSSKQQ